MSLRPLFAQIVAHAICKVDSSTPPRYFGLLDAVAQVEHQLKLRAATTTQGDHHGPVEIALRQKIAQLPAANAQSLKIRAALASNVARDFCLRFGVDPDWLDDLAGKQTLNVQIPIGTVLLVPVAKFASSLSTYLSGSDLSGLLPQPRNTLFGLIRLTHIHHQRHRDVTGGAGGARVDWRAAFNQLWSEGGWPDKAAMLAELSKDGHSPGLDRLKIITQWDSVGRIAMSRRTLILCSSRGSRTPLLTSTRQSKKRLVRLRLAFWAKVTSARTVVGRRPSSSISSALSSVGNRPADQRICLSI